MPRVRASLARSGADVIPISQPALGEMEGAQPLHGSDERSRVARQHQREVVGLALDEA